MKPPNERPKLDVDTAEFRRTSALSRGLRRVVELIVMPLSEPELRGTYREQLPEASRNVEVALEGLARLLATHPAKAIHVLRAILNWRARYFEAQRAVGEKDRYLVYTQLDAAIPFRPEEDTMYTYMISQLAYVSHELCDMTSTRLMKEVAEGFIAANALGREAFVAYPTLMPRFVDHKRLSLRVVQRVDEPVNCCPSLHIAYSVLLDNIAAAVIAPHAGGDRKRDVFDAIRYSTMRMFNSVLYTKQHSLLDVAFGILCAKVVYDGMLAERLGRAFDDLLRQTIPLQSAHPHIEYGAIRAMYADALEQYTRHGKFAAAVGGYLVEHGFSRVGPGTDVTGSYFDTTQRVIVTAAR